MGRDTKWNSFRAPYHLKANPNFYRYFIGLLSLSLEDNFASAMYLLFPSFPKFQLELESRPVNWN